MIDKEIQESEEKARRLEEESVLKTFWSESENIVMKAPSGHKLKDIARYEVRVKENTVPEGDLQELDAEKKVFACTILKGWIGSDLPDFAGGLQIASRNLPQYFSHQIPFHFGVKVKNFLATSMGFHSK